MGLQGIRPSALTWICKQIVVITDQIFLEKSSRFFALDFLIRVDREGPPTHPDDNDQKTSFQYFIFFRK